MKAASNSVSLREPVACAAILIAVLSGKLQLPLGPLGIEDSAWTEIRLWSLLAGAILFWPEIRSISWRDLTRPVFISFVALLCFLFGRSLFDATPLTPAKQLDLLYLFVQALLVAVAVFRPHRVALLAYTILALASAYLLIAIGGQVFEQWGSKVNYGLGWGPVGGPITFNRVQFLAFCVAMCLAIRTPRRRILFGAFAALFLFAAMASLQKAAILAAGITLGFAGLWFLLQGRWRQFGALAIISVAATGALLGIYGDRLSGRIERMTSPQETPATLSGGTLQAQPEAAPPAAIDLPAIPPDTGSAESPAVTPVAPELPVERSAPTDPAPALVPEFIVPEVPQPTTNFSIEALGILVRYCVYEHPQVAGEATPPVTCPAAEFSDRSSRLTFWAEAIRGALKAPLFGHGLASYVVTVPNPYTLRPDTYLYPHNLILEVAYEAGTIAVALLLLALLVATRSSFLSKASLQTRVYTMSFMAFLAIGTLFSGDFYDSRLFWFGAITLAFWKAWDRRNA